MRIMLACNAGLSTSLVVARMQDAAKEQGKDYRIWAVDQGEIQGEIGNFDVLLLGPQVRHIMKRIKKMVGENTPVDIIEPSAYGLCNGGAVLKQAEKLYEQNK